VTDSSVKKCSVCKVEKKPEDFSLASKTRDGRSYTCRSCSKAYRTRNRQRLTDYRLGWVEQNREHVSAVSRARGLRRRFGMTVDQYDALLIAQGGTCAMCDKTPEQNGRALAVDHDHTCCPDRMKTCGACIRGLLCTVCNNRLGILEDRDFVAAATMYLNGSRYMAPRCMEIHDGRT
jgi:hypothetical protein